MPGTRRREGQPRNGLVARVTVTLLILCLTEVVFSQDRVVRISPPAFAQAVEASIAVNPKNPDNIIATFVNFDETKLQADTITCASFDGGATWTCDQTPNPDHLVLGDPSVAFGPDGTAYHAFLPLAGLLEARPNRAYSGVHVATSSDGGRSWNDAVPVVAHLNSVVPFEDKPYVVVDKAPGSRTANTAYVAWTRFDEYASKSPDCRSHVYFSRSTDNGKSWSVPVRVSDSPGDCQDSDATVQGAIVCPGLQGQVYVVWSGPAGLVMDVSLDGGLTFGKDRVILEHAGGWDINVPGLIRANGLPVVACDVSSGPNRGTIYVNWVDVRNGDPDVFVASSHDGGAHWAQPVRVNAGATGNGKAQFLTWMAVDPIDGSVNVAYYDSEGLDGTKTRVTMARSVDGGRTFVNHAIGLDPFECNDKVFFGDYLGIDAYGGLAAVVFAHFENKKNVAVSAAVLRFRPGAQERVRNAGEKSD